MDCSWGAILADPSLAEPCRAQADEALAESGPDADGNVPDVLGDGEDVHGEAPGAIDDGCAMVQLRRAPDRLPLCLVQSLQAVGSAIVDEPRQEEETDIARMWRLVNMNDRIIYVLALLIILLLLAGVAFT